MLLPCLPFLIALLNMCISYHVVPVGGYEQELEQEEVADSQVPSFEETNPGSYWPCLRVFDLYLSLAYIWLVHLCYRSYYETLDALVDISHLSLNLW
jgi:hypothetical protein